MTREDLSPQLQKLGQSTKKVANLFNVTYTFINVVPNADISKTHKIIFFSIILKISIFASQNFVRIYLCVVWNHPVQKIGVFLGKMAGEQGKVMFCYISISYLKTEIRQVLRPSRFQVLRPDMFLPWKKIKGRGFVWCNTTFRCICSITFSWAQSKVRSVKVNFERRLYVRKDITADNFLHNL